MANKYAFKGFDKENMAKAMMKDAPISTKQSIEISNAIRKKDIANAKSLLKKAIKMKSPIKFTRFNKDTGHKKGVGPAKYPKKAASHFISLLEMLESNAQFKGLDSGKMVIKHICANKAQRPNRFGRQRRRKAKRTHIQIIAEQIEQKQKDKKDHHPKKEVIQQNNQEKTIEKKESVKK